MGVMWPKPPYAGGLLGVELILGEVRSVCVVSCMRLDME